MSTVKRPDKRAERSRQTREKIIDAARDLFVEDGYGATNLQAVADRAGVAVQTIYFVFHNKRTLFKDVVDTTIAGDTEPVATMDRPWFQAALAAETADDLLRTYTKGSRAILDRVAPIMAMVASASAADPEIATLWPTDTDPRYTVVSTLAKSLVTKPDARPGLTPKTAADIIYALLSPELYLVLVRDRSWPSSRYQRWAHELLRTQLTAT
ncbi:MAG TPA: helix-turn-helix domain-containing protein [Streptosporangiaceae bacterium]